MGNDLVSPARRKYIHVVSSNPKLAGDFTLNFIHKNTNFREKRESASYYEIIIDPQNSLVLTSNTEQKPHIGTVIVYRSDSDKKLKGVTAGMPVLLVKWSEQRPTNELAVSIHEGVSLAEFRVTLLDAVKSWGKLNTFSLESSEKIQSRLAELPHMKKKDYSRWHQSVLSELPEREKEVFLRFPEPGRYDYQVYSSLLMDSLKLTQSYVYHPKELGKVLTIRDEKFPDLFGSIKLFNDKDLKGHIPEMEQKYSELNETTLSKSDFMAIYIYTLADGDKSQQSVFKLLNDHMTKTRDDNLRKCRFYIAYLCEALKKLPPVSGVTVYRGVSRNLVELYPSIYQIGNIKTFYSFTSTSVDKGVGVDFASHPDDDDEKGTLMVLEGSEDGRDIRKCSAYQEAEILLPPGVSFRIKDIVEKKMYYEVRLEKVQNQENLLEGHFE